MTFIDDFGDPDVAKRREEQKRIAQEIRRKGKAPSAREIEKMLKAKDRNLPAMQNAALADVIRYVALPLSAPMWPTFAANWIGLDRSKPSKELKEEGTIVEAISGWRRWSVEMFGDVLMSNNRVKWPPYEKLKAECKAQFGAECRGVHCDCGIYAYKQRTDVEQGENQPSAVTHVWGEVWLWGRVVEHTNGYRAQFAYPKALVNTGGIARQIAAAYGVKLID